MQISDSPNISVFDVELTADLCAGKFYINLDPSVWITSEASVLGIKYEIVNPYSVAVRPYGSGYDTFPVDFNVPTQEGNYQYGTYLVNVTLYDSDGEVYELTKTVKLCAPNSLDKTKKYGTLGAKITGVCKESKVYVLVDSAPVYNAEIPESAVNSFDFFFPYGSKATFNTATGNFSEQLFEGVYKITGEVCAKYNFGENVFVKVNYKLDYEKPVTCSLDECCVFEGLQALNDKLASDCTPAEKKETDEKIKKSAILLDTIDYGIRCGEDISDYVLQLEKVLSVSCGCKFKNATPFVSGTPSGDVVVQGCNVTSDTVGLTTTYTIENYSYVVAVAENGGALTISNSVLEDCDKTQTLTFNINNVYTKIKGLANADSSSWAAILKKSLNGLNVACLGLDTPQLTALTFDDLFQKVIDKACLGGNCAATINSATATQDGGDVVLTWTQTGSFAFDIYVDGALDVTVLGTVLSYRLIGMADGLAHTYMVYAKCSNGAIGTYKNGTFGFAACPTINPPVVSTPTVTSVCPYNLTGVVNPLPTGITAEWHNQNNHLAATLINETSVSDGVYYVFATNGANCYSTGVKVTVICDSLSSCTAPQSLSIVPIIGGLSARFASAVYPPPSNSYTIQRKLQGQAEGSYVTIGIPTFNVSTNKWEYNDMTAAPNVYYSYRAISNCTGGAKYISVDYVNITCPTVSRTVTRTTMDYSFAPLGGDITKYVVSLYDGVFNTLLDSNTYLPSFTNPITGSFTGLTEGTNYRILIDSFVGTVKSSCAFIYQATSPAKTVTLRIENNSTDMALSVITIDTITPTLFGGGLPVAPSDLRTSNDIFASSVDVYLEWTNTLTTQSVTVYDTLGTSVCLAESEGLGHTVLSVDNTGELPIIVELNAGVC